jgi:hypothetical protein
MKLLLGEIICLFGLFYYYWVLFGVASPVKPWWVSPVLNNSLHLFVILASVVFGPILIILGAANITSLQELTVHAVVFAAVLTGIVYVVRRMRSHPRLKTFFAAQERYNPEDTSVAQFPGPRGAAPGGTSSSGSHVKKKAA